MQLAHVLIPQLREAQVKILKREELSIPEVYSIIKGAFKKFCSLSDEQKKEKHPLSMYHPAIVANKRSADTLPVDEKGDIILDANLIVNMEIDNKEDEDDEEDVDEDT